MNQTHKNILKLIKDGGFGIDIVTNLNIKDFLNTTLNINNDPYRPCKMHC